MSSSKLWCEGLAGETFCGRKDPRSEFDDVLVSINEEDTLSERIEVCVNRVEKFVLYSNRNMLVCANFRNYCKKLNIAIKLLMEPQNIGLTF